MSQKYRFEMAADVDSATPYAPEEEVSPEQYDTAVPPQSIRAPMTQGHGSEVKHGGSSHLAPSPPSEKSQRLFHRLDAKDNSIPTRPVATGTVGQEMSENTGIPSEPRIGAHGQDSTPAAYESTIHNDAPEHINFDDVPHPLSTVNTADLEQDHVAYVRRSLNLLHLNPCGDAHFFAAYGSALHRNDALTTPCRTDALEHTNLDDVLNLQYQYQ